MGKIWLECIKCNIVYPLSKDILNCTKHSPYYSYLTFRYEYEKIKLFKNKDNSPWERYLNLLPVESLQVNFNEQKTPLIKLNKYAKKYDITEVYVKDESKNPTGSFKDKESICAINKALEWGVDKVFVVSSGNAAVSTAAYAQKAGISCECIVSKHLSAGKRFLIDLYGAKLIKRDGNYESLYRSVIDKKVKGWNCTPGINPFKEEGIKIIGFEIWEDIGVPDAIVVPCGNGTLLYGVYKAFKELQLIGLIDRLPKMIGVQVKNANPLKVAYETKKEYVALRSIPESIAEGILAQESYSSPKVMLALSETKGMIIEVDESEIKKSLSEIVQLESLIPEPTSAVIYAATSKLGSRVGKKVVLVQTASGMKNLKEIMEARIQK